MNWGIPGLHGRGGEGVRQKLHILRQKNGPPTFPPQWTLLPTYDPGTPLAKLWNLHGWVSPISTWALIISTFICVAHPELFSAGGRSLEAEVIASIHPHYLFHSWTFIFFGCKQTTVGFSAEKFSYSILPHLCERNKEGPGPLFWRGPYFDEDHYFDKSGTCSFLP